MIVIDRYKYDCECCGQPCVTGLSPAAGGSMNNCRRSTGGDMSIFCTNGKCSKYWAHIVLDLNGNRIKT